VLQVLLALAFLLAGVMKVGQPREKLAASMGWLEDFPTPGCAPSGCWSKEIPLCNGPFVD
jgi:hypothetical protein